MPGATDEPGIGVVLLCAGLTERGAVVGEWVAAASTTPDHALQDVDRFQRCLTVEYNRARAGVRVRALSFRVSDEFDVIGFMMHTLVSDCLHTRRHVERAEFVCACRKAQEGVDRSSFALRLACIEIR